MREGYFSGVVQKITYSKPADSFYILRMSLEGQPSSVTVKGSVINLDVKEGTWFGFSATWVQDPKYGQQLKIIRAPYVHEWTTETACRAMLSQDDGMALSSKIRALRVELGDDLVKQLDDALASPERPETLKLDLESFDQVVDLWGVTKALYDTMSYLHEVGVPPTKILQAWRLFGDGIRDFVRDDPWMLLRIDGFTLEQADLIASKIGIPLDSPGRVRGILRDSYWKMRGLGHLYVSSDALFSRVMVLSPRSDLQEVAIQLRHLVDRGEFKVERDIPDLKGARAIYDPWSYEIEVRGAQLLTDRLEAARIEKSEVAHQGYLSALSLVSGVVASDLSDAAARALQAWYGGTDMQLSPLQEEGVVNALKEPVSVITGLPGTGKSTSLRAIVSILVGAGVNVLCVAPTGIAAKRMQAITGHPASTVHRAFMAQGMSDSPDNKISSLNGQGYGERWGFEDEPHPAQVVICDEVSMVDQHMLYRILVNTRDTARLVFIGDAEQLPSVGAGNVLSDVITSARASGRIPVVSLTDIFRQQDTSDIVDGAHSICRGDIPQYVQHPTKDFRFVSCEGDEDSVLESIVNVAERLKEMGKKFQVLSPAHNGLLGVTSLNDHLRSVLNPYADDKPEFKFGDTVLRVNDRVMIVKNDYKLEVFNGDFGKIVSQDHRLKTIRVKIHGTVSQYVDVPSKDAQNMLKLAYCVTVHKMQGQESDIIVLPWVSSFGPQLQRNLLYTAVTRARKKVFIIGDPGAVAKAVQNAHKDSRNTLFSARLLKLAGA